MMKSLTQKLKQALAILIFTLPLIAPASTHALNTVSTACGTLSNLNSSQDCSSGGSSFTNVVGDVVNVLSLVVGALAVIMIIVSGLRFITSGGDSQKAASARTALLYALVGLAVAALAQVLVQFVLFKSANAA